MPKILIGVSSSFCANFLKGQVNFLVHQGFDVVIVSGPGEEISMLAKSERAKLITIPFTKRITPFTDLVQLLKLIRILLSERPDIINAGNPKSGFLIMLAAWLLRSKNRVFTLHGLVSDTKTGLSGTMISLTEKVSCAIAHQVIVVSPSLKQHAEERRILKKGKGIVIENGSCNGIDIEVFSKNAAVLHKAGMLKKEWGIKDNELVIGFVGRLSKDKGIDILIKSFNSLLARYPYLKLLVAGPLLEKHGLEDEVVTALTTHPNIVYLGKVADVTPVYAATHIFVLSSLREGFGNVLIEAASMEVPVIAPDIPGCRDALKPGVNGVFFEKGNAASLNNSIERLTLNSELRKEYGYNGRQFVVTNFSNEKIWQGLLEIYKTQVNHQS